MDKETRPDRCVSCHHQTFPGIAFGWAAQLKIPLDKETVVRQTEAQVEMWRKLVKKAWAFNDPLGTTESTGYGLLNFAANGYPADEITDSITFYLSCAQQRDGKWLGTTARPPSGSTHISSTALAVRSLQIYPSNEPREKVEQRNALIRQFLLDQHPFAMEERSFQILGLLWADGRKQDLNPLLDDLIKQQRPDGGWSQLPTLESDAYATGQALLALTLSRKITIDDSIYVRGVEFLLRTQFADGSWFVRSRTWPFQTHFSTGFPHGRNQWISSAATAWATLALMTTLDPEGPSVLRKPNLLNP